MANPLNNRFLDIKSKTQNARRAWKDTFKALKENNF
jgi:hypothetical protein